MIHLDTTLVVDLLREASRKEEGPATSFFKSVPDEDIWISVFVACELFAGAELSASRKRETRRVRRVIDSVHLAYPDSRFAAVYGRLLARQQQIGEMVPLMDLLIATTAIVADAPLATRNIKHFSRISELQVISY